MLKTFKNQLIAFTVGITLLITLTLAFLSYRFIYKNVLSMAISYNNEIVDQLCQNISLFLNGIDKATESLARSSVLRFYNSSFVTPGIVPTRDEIKAQLWKTVSQESRIDDISMVSQDKKQISLYNMYQEEDLLLLCQYYEDSEILVNAKFVPRIHFNANGHPALSCITISGSATEPCYIISSVIVDEIFDLCQNLDLGDGSGICLIDSQDSIQYSTTTETGFQTDMNTLIRERDFSQRTSFISALDGEDYILSIYPLTDSLMSAVAYIPLKHITQMLFPLLFSMLGSILLLMFVFSLASVGISRRLTAPIVTLAQHMSAVDTYLKTDLPSIRGPKEINILFSAFQEMLARIRLLLEENKRENKRKRQAELSALQSQINPHFLYNTLDSINALAILNNQKEISKMTTSLGQLLRRSLDNPSEYHTLETEFEHVKAYLAIQKIRYEDHFHTEFHMDSQIRDFPVIRLILQPLVENCIYHGLEMKPEPGQIEIIATDAGDSVMIQTKDNGIGVSAEAEALIQQNLLACMEPGPDSSVGIYNVNKRLRLHYGKDAFVTFHSTLNKGTTVTLHIPKNKEANHVENRSGGR